MTADTTLLRRARQLIDHLARHSLLRDPELDLLREALRAASQRDDLLEAITVVRAREADALEALRCYLAAHSANGPCSCRCCAAAQRTLRR
jgi:hypothetical protein